MSKAKDLKNISLIIRILTVAPLLAAVMILTLYFNAPLFFANPVNCILMLLFLTVIPLLAYPLQPLIKGLREKGREGQRTLAIYFSVAGYVFGIVSAVIFSAPAGVKVIYLAYLLSGIFIMIFNKVFHIKASGHACGAAGPFAILLYFRQPIGYLGIPLLALVWLSSLRMKRHTNMQLLFGMLISILSLGVSILLCKIV